MSSELDQLFHAAWEKVWPKLQADPDELAFRLARRRRPGVARPLRAFCLAVRASDRRMNPATAAMVPEDAAYPFEAMTDEIRAYHRPAEHTVRVDAALLRRLCRPVWITPPGQPVHEVARMLGTHPACLRWGMRCGFFRVRKVPGLGGRWGRPVRVIMCDHALDPCAIDLRRPPDPVWGAAWEHLVDSIPDDFEQTLVRVPVFYDNRPLRGERKGPRRAGRGDRGHFRRWLWVCPGCRKVVRCVYLPRAPMTFAGSLGIDPAVLDVDAPPAPPVCLACRACHHIAGFSTASPDAWNTVVSRLSGGLLYGKEVKRPEWFSVSRRRAYRPQLMRAPSVRRAQVLERILKGMKYLMIARELGIGDGTVTTHARNLFRQNGVRTRKELEARFARLRNAGGAARARRGRRPSALRSMRVGGADGRPVTSATASRTPVPSPGR